MSAGKLYLVGLGLAHDLITLRGLNAVKSSDIVYLDKYTSLLDVGLKELSSILGKEVVPIGRKELEEKSDEVILSKVREGKIVSLLIVGNPLVATTHEALIVEAGMRGLKVEIIPAPGIIPNALTMSGLMIYKFGKPVTLTYPVSGKISEYPYEVVKHNDERNLHTVLLLEMDAEKGIMMTIKDAIEIMFHLENLRKEGVFRKQREAVAVSALGTRYQRICFNTLEELAKLPPHEGPHTIIITSPKLHFMEKDALKVITNEYCRE